MADELIRTMLGPGEPEIDCDECFEQLDRYVDLELAGDDAPGGVPGMEPHLRGCPACREEYESLRELALADRDL